MEASAPVGSQIARNNAALATRAVPERQAALDTLQEVDCAGAEGPVGFWGVSPGSAIGVPLVAAGPRITAAVFTWPGMRLSPRRGRVTVPVEFLLQ
jgi:hypothetical protein